MPLPRRTHQQHRTTTGDNTIRRRGRCPHRPGGGQSQNCTHFRRKRKTFCRGGRLCPPDGQPQIFHCVSQKRSCVIRVDVGIDPYKRGAYLHRCIHFCGCVPPGGQGRPPLRVHSFPHRCIQFCNCIPPLRYDELFGFSKSALLRRRAGCCLRVSYIIPFLTRRGKTPPATFRAPAPPRPQGGRRSARQRPRRCCRSGSQGAGRALRRSAPPPPPCAG